MINWTISSKALEYQVHCCLFYKDVNEIHDKPKCMGLYQTGQWESHPNDIYESPD